DQTLAFGGRIYSKPADRAAAHTQLRSLAGRTHALHSAVAVVEGGAMLFAHVETARLTMRPVSDAFLGRYLDAVGDRVLASVGGYQLEGLGIHLFEKIEGDYFTILGLPILSLLGFFREAGHVAQ
ncbi:MAG: Maf family protein, partial [Rhizobiales bacterium]|nr:Maf family protein [Hyphomicrobiales bacterium]